MNILVTGAAGFIGFHLSQALLNDHHRVLGIDNLNDYYDVNLKKDRLNLLKKHENFRFIKMDLAERDRMEALFQTHEFDVVVNLAAQAGVRYSLINPHAYFDANLVGFSHVLEECRKQQVKHLVFASSSSVYGANTKIPFSESDNVDHPISLYAATKKANELMAHSYAHLHGLPCTGLRFFTVYGPWGRPDMALFKFVRNILEGKPIDVFNHGNMERDFTYIDDIVDGIVRVIHAPAKPNAKWSGKHPDPATSSAPYRIYNIGNNQPVSLADFIATIETALSKKAIKNFLPLQPGDVERTYADITRLKQDCGFSPQTSIQEGVRRFVDWYKNYYASLLAISEKSDVK
ncbi:MAG TPA: NAD-dependent epimerase [Coxiellaceae bacterium]|nr:NAD-dependent epimerase [Coxiellaceae bacterium]